MERALAVLDHIYHILPSLLLIASGALSFIIFWILTSKRKIASHKPNIFDLLSAIMVPPILLIFDRFITVRSNVILLVYIGVGFAWGHTIATMTYWQLRYKRKKAK